jgi:CO dehydrogenase maturation factor
LDEAEREARRKKREAWATDNLSRQTAVIDDLGARAVDPLGWLGVRRQANSYLRHLATWQRSKGYSGINEMLDAHEARLHDWVRRADESLARVDPAERADAERRMGLRLAIMGKGGAGKTVISSTLSRLLARRGHNVLAADLDTNPGLAYSIGLGRRTEHGLPLEALEENPGAAYGWQLRTDLLPREAVEQYALSAPDGVAFLSLGKIGERPGVGVGPHAPEEVGVGAPAGPDSTVDKTAAKRTVVALIQILLGFGEPGWDVIADLEAGPTTPFERYHAFADDVVVVVGPAWRSAMTARRLLPMVGEGRTTTIVANRFRDEPDHPGITPSIRIPFDPDVAEAERQGLSPLDECPDSPAIRAIAQVAELFAPEPRSQLGALQGARTP